ncbi:MAG: hypothetical protein K5765_04305 [Clostridia bacterium]|nr:hypothetical protein [Clostridia bacterium]
MKLYKKILIVGLIFTCLILSLFACGNDEKKDEYYPEDKEFSIASANVNMMNLDLQGMIDSDRSYAKFTSDGKVEMKIYLSNATRGAIAAAALAGKDEFEHYDTRELQRFIKPFATSFFPGYDITDMPDIFDKAYENIGFKIEGINWDSQFVQEFVVSLKETPEDVNVLKLVSALNKDLCIAVKTTYALFDITNSEGKVFKAIFFGDYHDSDADPYFVLTRTIDEETKLESVLLINEILKLEVTFQEKQIEAEA